jgi:hypothetical protein
VAAANLEPPPGFVPPPTTDTRGTTTAPRAGTTVPEGTGPGWAIVNALDLDSVSGSPELDNTYVLRAMEAEREAIEDALREGRDWESDPLVVSTANQLRNVLVPFCPS